MRLAKIWSFIVFVSLVTVLFAGVSTPVAGGSTPPHCDIGYTGYAYDGYTIKFYPYAYDDDGTIVSYAWTFGDGTTSTEANPEHVYTTPPHYYTVKLTVTDNDGLTATDSYVLTVQGPVSVTVSVTPNKVVPLEPFDVSGRLTDTKTGAGVKGQVHIHNINDGNPNTIKVGAYVDTTPDGYFTYRVASGLDLAGNTALNTWALQAIFASVISTDPPVYRTGVYGSASVSVCGASSLTIDPSAPAVQFDKPFTLTGKVELGGCLGTGGRLGVNVPIDLQKWNGATWVDKSRTRTDSTGSYKFTVKLNATNYFFATESNVVHPQLEALSSDGYPVYYRVHLPFNISTAFENWSNYVTLIVYPQTTTLNATVSPTTALVNQNFIVKGRLTASGAPLIGRTITLQRSLDNKTFTTLTTKGTSSTGWYSFSRSETTARTYYYRTTYAGDATYANATSNVVKVAVKKPTTFLISTSTTIPTTNVPFTLLGTLKSGTTALKYQQVHLERRSHTGGAWGAWANVANTFKYTNATGAIKLSQAVATAGTYQFRWHYNGTTTYEPAYSAAVTETVKKPTSMTITTSTTTPKLNVAFTLSGTLKSGTTGLVGYSVHLEQRVGSGSWADVVGATKTTGTGGVIPSVSQTVTTPATYSYRWHFTGTVTYKSCYSPVKTFTV